MIDETMTTDLSQWERWWLYQKERFPLLKNGLLILIFSIASVCYSALIRQGDLLLPSGIVAFINTFCFFLQLRIADEFKDQEEDQQYRSYRPVPQGIITLDQLKKLGMITLILPFILTGVLKPIVLLFLLITLVYLGLMRHEFFVKTWLKQHPLIYLLSHLIIVPLINFNSIACDWFLFSSSFPSQFFWFLVVSFFNGMVIEIGRKIRSPEAEEIGVETYSYLWGRTKATLIWIMAILITAIATLFASDLIHFLTPTLVLITIALIGTLIPACLFLKDSQNYGGEGIEMASGIWVLLVYLTLGIIPYGIQTFSGG